MKAKVPKLVSYSDIKREVEKEYKRCEQRTIERTSHQLLAYVLYVLSREYGFGAKRLRRLLHQIDGISRVGSDGVLGLTFDTEDMIEYINKRYRIDLQDEFRIELDWK